MKGKKLIVFDVYDTFVCMSKKLIYIKISFLMFDWMLLP